MTASNPSLIKNKLLYGEMQIRINVLSKMGLFVTVRLRFQLKLLTNIKKNSILGMARVLGLSVIDVFKNIFELYDSVKKNSYKKLNVKYRNFQQASPSIKHYFVVYTTLFHKDVSYRSS